MSKIKTLPTVLLTKALLFSLSIDNPVKGTTLQTMSFSNNEEKFLIARYQLSYLQF